MIGRLENGGRITTRQPNEVLIKVPIRLFERVGYLFCRPLGRGVVVRHGSTVTTVGEGGAGQAHRRWKMCDGWPAGPAPYPTNYVILSRGVSGFQRVASVPPSRLLASPRSRRAILMMPKDQRPPPRRSFRYGGRLHDAADHNAVAQQA